MTDGMLKEIETAIRRVMTEHGVANIDRMIKVNHDGPLIKVDAHAYNHYGQGLPSFDMSVWLARRGETHKDGSMKRTMIIFNGHISPMTRELIAEVTNLVDATWQEMKVERQA